MTTSLVTYLETVVPSSTQIQASSTQFLPGGGPRRRPLSALWMHLNCPEKHSELVHLLGCEHCLRVSSCWDKIITFFRSYRTDVRMYYHTSPPPSQFSVLVVQHSARYFVHLTSFWSSQQQYEAWYHPLDWWKEGGWWRLGSLSRGW